MITRIIGHSITRRRRRKVLTLVAVALGIAVTTTVGTIALDVGDKVSMELRSFGANISVTPAAESLSASVGGVRYRPTAAGAFLAEANLIKLKQIFWRNNILAFAPSLDVSAQVEGRPLTLIGTWFQKEIQVDKFEVFRTGLKQLHPAWKVKGQWPDGGDPAGCLVGRRLAGSLGVRVGQKITVEAPLRAADGSARLKAGATAVLTVRGILETGGPEDDQMFAPLAVAQELAGLEGTVRRVDVSALTKPEDPFTRSDVSKLSPQDFDRWYCSPYVRSIAYQIQEAIPGSEANPVYQVAESEGKILNRIGVLMGILVATALTTAALAVASMMLATVLERRVEIGLFKTLGATNARVATIFLLEASVVGFGGGVVGYIGGSLLARPLARVVFGSAPNAHWAIFPAVAALALLVTWAGSALPLLRGLRVSSAMVLRDE